jgi:Protein of unknown function (DUF2811)
MWLPGCSADAPRLDRDTTDTWTDQTHEQLDPLTVDQAPLLDPRHHLQRCLEQPRGGAQPAPRVSLEAEVPEVLFDGMRSFLQSRPDWDQYRVITSALAGFLFQNGCSDRCVAQHYLNGLFMSTAE